MDEKNNGARRRRAFADFKENQYSDSLSLSPVQKKNRTVKKVFTIAFIVILTVAFIVLGFCFTDSLLTISEKPYKDRNTYTAAYVNTTTTVASADEENSSEQESITTIYSPYQNQSAGNY